MSVFCIINIGMHRHKYPHMRVNLCLQHQANRVSLARILTRLGRSSEAFEGSPAPSVIQGNSEDPLLLTIFATEVIISFNLACKKINKTKGNHCQNRAQHHSRLLEMIEPSKQSKERKQLVYSYWRCLACVNRDT